jgi:hypothetical protein
MNTQITGINNSPPAPEYVEDSPTLKFLKLEEKITKLVYFKKFMTKKNSVKCGSCNMLLKGTDPAIAMVCNDCL